MSESGYSFVSFIKDNWDQFIGFTLLVVGLTRSEINIRRSYMALYDKEDNLKLVKQTECNKHQTTFKEECSEIKAGINTLHVRMDDIYKLIAEGKK